MAKTATQDDVAFYACIVAAVAADGMVVALLFLGVAVLIHVSRKLAGDGNG